MALKSLVIDASTVVYQVGTLEGNRFTAFASSTDDTLPKFFSILSPFLNHFHYQEIIFCEGPGKLLGIHSTLMFSRIAKIIHPHIRIYSYSTLALAAYMRNRLSLPSESLFCVPRNSTQYYVFDNNSIVFAENEILQRQKAPAYCLTTHRGTLNRAFIAITYDLRDYADILRTIIRPNEAVETIYDPQNEYKKSQRLRTSNDYQVP
ncbi:MAG: hypothetical protein LBB05_01465 [Puniceicoccales bacterium]|nr:hypothetical protein [Puniceicoccales bacterium]